jgi:hypothetical protein
VRGFDWSTTWIRLTTINDVTELNVWPWMMDAIIMLLIKIVIFSVQQQCDVKFFNVTDPLCSALLAVNLMRQVKS